MLEDKGIKLEKLGFGKKYVGHFMKDLEMLEFLKDKKEDDIVIFVDGFDSLILGDKEEIIEKFQKSGKKLLLSVENVRSSFLLHSYNFQKVLGKFVNTGLYIGYAGYMRQFLEKMYSQDYNKKSNQKTWSKFINSKDHDFDLSGFGVDIDSELFLNDSPTCNNKFELKNHRLQLKSGSKPVFIQGNGCVDMDYIINDLGYESSNIHKDTFTKDKLKYSFQAVTSTYPILKLFVGCIILGISLIVLMIFIYRKIRRNEIYEMTFH
jgi:hypothetical protein